MYKLFLSLRYLRKLLMAYFAVLCVALCVAMMLIVISVMNGFLNNIENAAKGLFGDVVVDAPGLGGLGRYDEFIAEVNSKVPQIQAATPFIMTYGILQIPHTDHRQTVQIAGIRLPGRAKATSFAQGLFIQKDQLDATFDPPIRQIIKGLTADTLATEKILKCEMGEHPEQLTGDKADLCRRILDAMNRQGTAAMKLANAADYQRKLSELQRKLDQARAKARGNDSEKIDELREQIQQLEKESGIDAPANRIILGLGLPAMSFRTEQGETIRVIGPGEKVVLTLIPLGRTISATDITPSVAGFTVIDDCSTDVSSIDSSIVYVPFKTLQELNNMGAQYSADDPNKLVEPARCGQIHIKIKPEYSEGKELLKVHAEIHRVWLDFHKRNPDAAAGNVIVQTWRQYQARFIGPIEKQRTLTVIMFSIISLVSVILIFVIFYMIVYQKIRDIGVLKALGASSSGVAGIFLIYGAAVGLAGSIIGTVGGYYFVRYINEIQDAFDRWFGFRVWSREVFMFEKIPSQVEVFPALMIVAGAIVAGLLGALIPAIRSARMEPVEALRYE